MRNLFNLFHVDFFAVIDYLIYWSNVWIPEYILIIFINTPKYPFFLTILKHSSSGKASSNLFAVKSIIDISQKRYLL